MVMEVLRTGWACPCGGLWVLGGVSVGRGANNGCVEWNGFNPLNSANPSLFGDCFGAGGRVFGRVTLFAA